MLLRLKRRKLQIKYNYEIAVLEKLKELLVYKAIWIENSYRYRNPNDDIPKDYDAKKEEYCQMLGLPTTAKVFIDQLKTLQKDKLKSLNSSILNKVLDIRDKRVWKEATTTVACDSTQVSAWDQNLINEWHYRYKGKGVMILLACRQKSSLHIFTVKKLFIF